LKQWNLLPDIKIIVFSIDDRTSHQDAFDDLQMNGFVLKVEYATSKYNRKAYNNQSENISAELLHVFKTKLPAKLISTTYF
jgi:hypothetical protein